jgi:hypothetical protein
MFALRAECLAASLDSASVWIATTNRNYPEAV